MVDHELTKATRRDAERLKQEARNRKSVMAQTVFLGSLALLLVLPIIGGAYLGRWIDSLFAGYSIRWTVSLIVLGGVLGIVNVWLFVRERV